MDPVDTAQAQADVDGYFAEPPRSITTISVCGLDVAASKTYRNLPLADYLAWPLWSQSSLKEAAKSALHAKAARDASVRPPTDAMVLGSALHLAFLEPERAEGKVVVWLGKARRGQAWWDFQVANHDKIILTMDQYDRLNGMLGALRNNPLVQALTDTVEVEVAKIGDVCGLKMKGRADALGVLSIPGIYDLKTVKSADPRKFLNAVIQFGYDVQAAVYCELFERDNFTLIAVESDPPHDVVVFEMSKSMLASGRRKMLHCIEVVKQAEATGEWPGRSSTPITLEPPPWDVDTEPTVERCEPPEEVDP